MTPTRTATSVCTADGMSPEALMAVIEEVTAAYEKARADQEFLDELDRLQTPLHRTAVTVVRGGPAQSSTPAVRGCS